jgi:hypothetical protein
MALLKATELEGIGAVRFHVSGGPLVVDESTHSAPAAAAHHHLFATALTDCEQVEDDQLAGANSAIDNYYIHGNKSSSLNPQQLVCRSAPTRTVIFMSDSTLKRQTKTLQYLHHHPVMADTIRVSAAGNCSKSTIENLQNFQNLPQLLPIPQVPSIITYRGCCCCCSSVKC